MYAMFCLLMRCSSSSCTILIYLLSSFANSLHNIILTLNRIRSCVNTILARHCPHFTLPHTGLLCPHFTTLALHRPGSGPSLASNWPGIYLTLANQLPIALTLSLYSHHLCISPTTSHWPHTDFILTSYESHSDPALLSHGPGCILRP